MQEINGKKTLLQNEISRLNNEMQAIKMRTVNQPQLDKPAKHVMTQKDVQDNIKYIEGLEEEMQPVRLEYVQLKRSLDMIQNKYDDILFEREDDTDQVELQVENQVCKPHGFQIKIIRMNANSKMHIDKQKVRNKGMPKDFKFRGFAILCPNISIVKTQK